MNMNTLRIGLYVIALAAMLLQGCGRASTASRQLCRADSLITANKDSAALAMIERMDTGGLNGDDMAYYNLLKVRTMYKLNIPIKDDSLINICIDHYKNSGNNKMLAEAYYYKSSINNDRHNTKTAITYMKMAEEKAHNSGDNNLKFRIFERLSLYNANEGEYKLSIEYGHKSLKAAKRTNNNNYIAYAYTYLALGQMWNNNIDSAKYYLNKCIPYLKHMRVQDQAYIYDIVGEIHKKSKTEYAKSFLKKAIEINPLPWTYKRLAELYIQERNETEANKIWKKALSHYENPSISEISVKIEILEDMRELKQKYGYHREADSLAGIIIALKDSMEARKKQLAVKETQEEYDDAVAENTAKSRHNALAWGTGMAVTAAAAIFIVYSAIHRRDRRRIDRSEEKEAEYEQKIAQLDSEKKTAEKEMRICRRETRRRIDRQAEAIAEGRRLYEELTAGGNTGRWTKDDYLNVIEYLRTVDGKTITHLENDYDRLSPRSIVFAALSSAGTSDEDMMRMMCVAASTLRTMKTRIKQKARG